MSALLGEPVQRIAIIPSAVDAMRSWFSGLFAGNNARKPCASGMPAILSSTLPIRCLGALRANLPELKPDLGAIFDQ